MPTRRFSSSRRRPEAGIFANSFRNWARSSAARLADRSHAQASFCPPDSVSSMTARRVMFPRLRRKSFSVPEPPPFFPSRTRGYVDRLDRRSGVELQAAARGDNLALDLALPDVQWPVQPPPEDRLHRLYPLVAGSPFPHDPIARHRQPQQVRALRLPRGHSACRERRPDVALGGPEGPELQLSVPGRQEISSPGRARPRGAMPDFPAATRAAASSVDAVSAGRSLTIRNERVLYHPGRSHRFNLHVRGRRADPVRASRRRGVQEGRARARRSIRPRQTPR